MNAASILREYRAACRAARIDPAVGPVTTFESVNAIAAAQKARKKRAATKWWTYFDWLEWFEEGVARSTTEHIAIVHLWVMSLFVIEAEDTEGGSGHHQEPLRLVLADRGATLQWTPDEDGLIKAILVEAVGAAD